MCVGLIYPGSVWNSGVYEGGADHRIIVETMEVLRREYEEKITHDTEGGGATAKLTWMFLELRPVDYHGR